MKIKILFILINIISNASYAKEGTESGGGGDILFCENKIRFLDSYINEVENYYHFKINQSNTETLTNISNKLKEVSSELNNSFQKFLDTFEKKYNHEEKIYWTKGSVKNIPDENLNIELSNKCNNLTQIVRLKTFPIKRYYYNEELITKLKSQNDELSWLLTHEWLREFYRDADEIRVINGYLHSSEFLSQSNKNEIIEQFKKFNLIKTSQLSTKTSSHDNCLVETYKKAYSSITHAPSRHENANEVSIDVCSNKIFLNDYLKLIKILKPYSAHEQAIAISLISKNQINFLNNFLEIYLLNKENPSAFENALEIAKESSNL